MGCQKDPIREITEDDPVDPPDTTISYDKGIFILNEGNYNWGNASVTFIDNSINYIEQDLYNNANGRILGDVAQSMKIIGDNGWIIVNNSNCIEVVSLKDFKSVTTVSGFNKPRFMEVVDENKAYVTNIQKDISVVDLKSMTVVKTIKTPYWTESLIKYKNLMFITCYGTFNEPNSQRKSQFYIIDTKEDRIVDSIITGKEPAGIVIDKKDKMWILCSGGYDHFESPSLVRFDPVANLVEKTYVFTNAGDLPSRLCINPTGDTLYYLNNGIYQMPVTQQDLPSEPFIPAEGRLLYGLNIHPVKGFIYVTDAVDYVQNGIVYQYHQADGRLLRSYTAGRIPSFICFTDESRK